MAKKTKPLATKYEGLEIKKSEQGYCLVQDDKGKWYAFADHAKNHIVEAARKRVFKGIAELEANKETVAELHQELFNSTIGKGEGELAPYYVWAKLVNLAVDRVASTTTKSKLAGRIYTLLATKEQIAAIKTPQARVCAELLSECVDEAGNCPEEKFKAYVEGEAGDRLRTRQDKWRIFQYYRGMLIKTGILKHN